MSESMKTHYAKLRSQQPTNNSGAAYSKRQTLFALKTLLFVVINTSVFNSIAQAQTNPTAQSLPYTQNFGTTSFSSLPAGWASWSFTASSQAAAEASAPTANATVTARTTTTGTGGTYGYASASNGRIYLQSSSSVSNQMVLAFNSGSNAIVDVAYKLERLSGNANRTMGVVLQYRSGTSGAWQTVAGSAVSITSSYAATNYVFTLSGLTENTDYQIRFATWKTGNNSNSIGIGLDDVSVTGYTVSTGTITGSPFCVTSTVSASISVPFTSTGRYISNTYTAQLSNSSGSFASPTDIGTLVSDANSGTISATIPAGTAGGTGYKVRVISSNPSITGTESSSFTINSYGATNTIAPTTTQNINAGVNGNTLTATDASNPAGRQWAYSLSSSGPYTDITGQTGSTYAPNFATQGTYWVVCKSVHACTTIVSNAVRVNVSNTITVSSINQSKYCITATSGNTISVNYQSQGTFSSGNLFTVQLSNSTGSFAGATSLGTLSSTSGSGTITATIPSTTTPGTGYRVRVISSNPVVTTNATSSSTFEIALVGGSIAPTTSQSINAGANGTQLTVTNVGTPTSRQWAWGTVSGGPYNNVVGTGTTYTPNFSTRGTYYLVCKSTFACGTITSNEVVITVSSTLTLSSIGSTPVCVTATNTGSLNVNYTSTGGFDAGNQFSVQLSNSSGSFASPVTIATVTSTTASGTIAASIPANTATGVGYRVRVLSSNPAITTTESNAFTVNLAGNQVSPATTQNIVATVNGTNLTCTDQSNPNSRQWAYATTPGGPYTDINGQTGSSYAPVFATQGTYYVVCKSTYSCGTLTSNEVQVNVSNTITVSSVSPTSFCVTNSAGATVSVNYQSQGTFNTGNVFTVQMSNSAGSFSNPVSIGSVTATSGTGSISATVPAGTTTGTGYKIRIQSSNPAVTSSTSASNLTVNLAANAIAPTTTQSIPVNTNGTILTCTDQSTPSSRQWAYATTPGGPYTNISSATASTYTPRFASQGTYYVVCKSTYSCGTITSNEVQVNVASSITTGAISGSPFCVTSSAGISVSVPFTSTGSYASGNIYTAQLSDASGSFASPVAIGTLTSTSNTGSISATIPANTNYGTGYRIRVVSSNPAVTGSANGVNQTIYLSSNSISPAAAQTIVPATNGTTLTVTESSTATARQWAYATSPGGPYTNILLQTGSTYTPNFLTSGDYYVVCRSTFGSCGTITSNEVNVVVTSSPVLSSFTPANAVEGTTVTISGFNFTGTTDVTFGGTSAASFNVVNSTTITAVVAAGSSGSVTVFKGGLSASRTGFSYEPLNRIITDFGGYWNTTCVSPNSVVPNTSHNLLAFGYNGIVYSTGVNNTPLDNNGITYSTGNFKTVPLAGLTGTVSRTDILIAAASVIDDDPLNGNSSADSIKDMTVRSVLVDGPRGLNLGTGVTNLPSSAVMEFNVASIVTSKINDAEPDILITQIASPSGNIDTYEFLDASGNVVGNTIVKSQSALQSLGTYKLDLFSLNQGEELNTAKMTGGLFETAGGTRELRMTGFKLSDFGITSANQASIATLRITPSATSDMAFIAYNNNALSFKPTISINNANTITSILCGSGQAVMDVFAIAGNDGNLQYQWQVSNNGGGSWSNISNNGTYSGTATNKLIAVSPSTGTKFRVIVTEDNTGFSTTSSVFTITNSGGTPANPTISTQPVTQTVCANQAEPLLVAASGGVGKFSYQWQKLNATTSSYENIAGATESAYTPASSSSGSTTYRVIVSNLGCTGSTTSNTAIVTVTGGGTLTVNSASRCDAGTVTLTASATNSGTIKWYSQAGVLLSTGTSFTTPSISETNRYYAIATYSSPACETPSAPAVATVTATPSVLSATGATRCNAGSVTLNASASAGSISWFSSSTGGSAIATGSSYSPTISSSTTYYVAALDNGCLTSSRTPVTATIDVINGGSVSIPTNNPICYEEDTIVLTLSGSTGTITKWQYSTNQSTWTDIAHTSTTYQINSLTQNQYYRAVLSSGSCPATYSQNVQVKVKTCPPKKPHPQPGKPSIVSTGVYQYYKRDTADALEADGVTGAQLRWYTDSSGGSYTTVPPVPPTNAVGYYKYWVSQFIGGQESEKIDVSVVVKPITWYGGAGTSWTTGSNWRGGRAPESGDEVAIEENPVNPPQLDSNRVVGKLIFTGTGDSAYVRLNNKKLVIQDSLTGLSRFEGTEQSELEISGPANNTLRFEASGKKVKNLTINNSNAHVKVGKLEVYGEVKVSAGKLALDGDTLTLKGDATTYPQVGVIGTIATGAELIDSQGVVCVERYIPPRRAYRFLAASVNSSQSIRNNWQEGANNTSTNYTLNQNPNPGYGTHISGSKTGLKGFDATQSGAASLFEYVFTNGNAAWSAIPNTDIVKLKAGKPYRLMVRGDRSINMLTNNPAPTGTILRSWGTIVKGDTTMSLEPTLGAWNLVGNPYPANVDLSLVTKNNAAGIIYLFDPNLYNAADTVWTPYLGYNTGNYVSYDLDLDISSNISSDMNRYLQPGQSFYVQTLSTAPASITFKESDKWSADFSQTFKTSGTTKPVMNVSLFLDTAKRITLDGFAVAFDAAYADSFMLSEDAAKVSGSYESMFTTESGKSMSINKRSLPNNDDTVHMRINGMNVRNYTLAFSLRNFETMGVMAFLKDNYSGIEMPIYDGLEIPFNTTSVAASKAADRFAIIFKQSGTLPVDVTNVKAYRKNAEVEVEWTAENETNAKEYQVEKSINGTSFHAIGTVKAASGLWNLYKFTDAKPVDGYNYYRIKVIAKTGAFKYTNVVRVLVGKESNIAVYPNPVKNKVMAVELNNVKPGEYTLVLNNNLGQLVYTTKIAVNTTSHTQTVRLPQLLQNGIYNLSIASGAEQKNIKVVIE